MYAAYPEQRGRGLKLLLSHCSDLDGADEGRTPALERLQAAIGHELARMLVRALAGEGRRGRS